MLLRSMLFSLLFLSQSSFAIGLKHYLELFSKQKRKSKGEVCEKIAYDQFAKPYLEAGYTIYKNARYINMKGEVEGELDFLVFRQESPGDFNFNFEILGEVKCWDETNETDAVIKSRTQYQSFMNFVANQQRREKRVKIKVDGISYLYSTSKFPDTIKHLTILPKNDNVKRRGVFRLSFAYKEIEELMDSLRVEWDSNLQQNLSESLRIARSKNSFGKPREEGRQ